MPLGAPLAFLLGGGPAPAEAAYLSLKSAVGVGGSAAGGPRDTIVEAWRYAKARGLAATVNDERAALQVSPALATDLIPAFEQLLGTYFPAATSEQERRDVLAAAWAKLQSAAAPTLLQLLQEIDATVQIIHTPREQGRETQAGRAFEDWDPQSHAASGPAFDLLGSSPRQTQFPNYSDDFRLVMLLPLGHGVATPKAVRAIARIQNLLNVVLPAWVDFVVIGTRGGFILDVDLLDLTAMGP